MKPKTKDKEKFNDLRQIIRTAQSETKNWIWCQDTKISKCAAWQWNQLEKIFQKLGNFTEKDEHDTK
jgi:hypothetical protein